jgi:hypothetical protein
MVQGWALAAQGQVEEGIAQMRQSQMFFLAPSALAETYGKAGQVEEGLVVLADALALVDKTGGRVSEAELYRLKGELTLQKLSVISCQSSVTDPRPLIPKQKPKRVFSKLLTSLKSSRPSPWNCGPP